MTIVTPIDRGRRIRRLMIASSDHTPSQGDLNPDSVMRASRDGANEKLPQRPLDHRQIGAPGDHHHIALAFNVELPQAAFQNGGFAPLSGENARAHFDAWRLVAIEVAMELEATLAADQDPVAAFGGTLIEIVNRRAKIVEPSRTTGHKESRRRQTPSKLFEFDALKKRDNGRKVGIVEDARNEIEKLWRFGRRHLDDLEQRRDEDDR